MAKENLSCPFSQVDVTRVINSEDGTLAVGVVLCPPKGCPMNRIAFTGEIIPGKGTSATSRLAINSLIAAANSYISEQCGRETGKTIILKQKL